jgi:hypothetical protein
MRFTFDRGVLCGPEQLLMKMVSSLFSSFIQFEAAAEGNVKEYSSDASEEMCLN